ncbi:MAG: TOBE domain-containing protein, partial [Arcobacteraceae bacterium]
IRKFNITALFITHDKEDAFYLSDKIAIMTGGDIRQIGTPKDIYHNPVDLYCANFLGKMTQIDEHLYIRPEHIEICDNGDFDAIIKNIVFYGSFYEVVLSTKTREFICHSFDDRLELGMNVNFRFNGDILTLKD